MDTEKKNMFDEFKKDNKGVGVVELILILVVLIALVLVFKDQITEIVDKAFKSIMGNANKIIS